MPKMTSIIERYQPEQPVLSLRKTPDLNNFHSTFTECYEKVSVYLNSCKEIMTDVPFIIYYDYLYMDPNHIDVEICFPISKMLPPKDDIISRIIPATRIIFSMYRGAYKGISELYGEMTQWIMERGYEPEGYSYEYYFNGIDFPESELLIKVVIPYKEITY